MDALDIRPLHPMFGAEVNGLDLRNPLDDTTFAAMRAAFEQYSFLVLHAQKLTDEQQLDFARRFGPLEPTKIGTVGHRSELVHLTNVAPDGSVLPETHRQMLNTLANQLWHSDSSFKPIPALASILSGRVVPPEGGETEFVSMRAVWRELPSATRMRIATMVAIHDYAYSRGKIDPELATEVERAALPPVRQAMMRTHSSGEQSLYVGSHAKAIEGLDVAEGRSLIEELIEFAGQPRFIYSHSWRQHDLLIWDNRFTIHRGRPFPPQYPRYLVRATVAGDKPTSPA